MELVRRVLRYLVGLVLIGVVLASGVALYALIALNRPAGTPGPPQSFTVDSGEHVPSIAARLESEHLIESALLFQVMLKLRGADGQIKAGEFQLRSGMTPAEIITTLTQTPAQAGVRVTIKEGERIAEIADQLALAGLVDRNRFLQATQSAAWPVDFLPDRVDNL